MNETQRLSLKEANDDFLELLNLCYLILRSLEGKRIPYRGWGDTLPLIKQLFVHSMTIFTLKDGIHFKFSNQEYEELFIEFPSIMVLTRSIIENYYNLRQVFFLTYKDDDLFEFEYCFWKLSGYKINESTFVINHKNEEGNKKTQDYLETLRNRLKKTNQFGHLLKKEQKKTLNGIRNINWDEISDSIGIDKEERRFLYSYLNSFVHADGFSVDQVIFSKSQEDSKKQILFQTKIVTIILSKLIIDLFSLVNDIKPICLANRKAFNLAIDYSDVKI